MNKNFIRIIIISLIFIFLAGCSNVHKAQYETTTYKVTVQGSVFGGNPNDNITTEVSFSTAWVTSEDNTKYNEELAQFAAILSDDVYFRAKDLTKSTQNRVLYEGEDEEQYDWTSFLKNMGFSETEYIESYKAREYSGDSNDSATLLLAHTSVDNKYDLFIIVLRGCFSAQEWISIFDPGSAEESYTDLTGQHPEWTDKTAFKGLDIAKNRAMEFINEFISENDNADCQNCVLVTGHSRGGALANMIGAEMEDREDVRSYTYTFNAPGVTTDEKAKEYKTVFNIFDSNDYYTDPLPFGEETFYRCGRDITAEISESEEIRAAISELKGRNDFTSLDSKTKSDYAELFGDYFRDRASLYDMKEIIQEFETEDEARAREELCLTIISSENGLGLEGLCSVERNGSEVSLSYCGGAVLISYAKSLAYGTAASDAAAELFEDDSAACEILSLLMANAAGISGGHLLINSYVLCKYGNGK